MQQSNGEAWRLPPLIPAILVCFETGRLGEFSLDHTRKKMGLASAYVVVVLFRNFVRRDKQLAHYQNG